MSNKRNNFEKKTILNTGEPVTYILTRKRVKNLNLRITADGCIHVSAPYRVSQDLIDQFVRARSGFILRARAKINSRRDTSVHPVDYADGEYVLFLGQPFPIKVMIRGSYYALFTDGCFFIFTKQGSTREDRARALDNCMKRECREVFKDIVDEVYPRFEAMGIGYPTVTVRKMKSRWGSCTPSKMHITLNLELIHAREECIRYVVVHEFCHFIYLDHSPAFHALVGSILPDWKMLKKELNETVYLG